GLCFASGGGLLLLLGLYFFREALRLCRDGIRVNGDVVGIENVEGTDFRVVEFVDLHAVRHRCRLETFSWGDPPVGRPMPLVYRPSDPAGTVTGVSFGQQWALPVACCLM